MKKPSDDAIPIILKYEGIENLNLTPEEAFVLSRVSGTSDLAEIGQILSLDTARVWEMLKRPIETGFIGIEEKKKSSTLVLPLQKQKELRKRYEALLKQNHYEVLGVSSIALATTIKEKYFELVKEFHPDRYYGRDLGEFSSLLEAVFERVSRAFEELIDPERRRAYDQFLQDQIEPSKDSSQTKIEKFLSKLPLSLRDKVGTAKRYHEMGKKEELAGNRLAAASFYQLAFTYEPTNKEYEKSHNRTRSHIEQKKAQELFGKAMEAYYRGDRGEAINLLERVLVLNPGKKECYHELAMIYREQPGTLEKARDMGMKALDFFPNDAKVHTTLGLIHKDLGNVKLAMKELQVALKLDQKEERARKALDELEGRAKGGTRRRN